MAWGSWQGLLALPHRFRGKDNAEMAQVVNKISGLSIALGLIGPGTVGKAVLEHLRVQASRRSPGRDNALSLRAGKGDALSAVLNLCMFLQAKPVTCSLSSQPAWFSHDPIFCVCSPQSPNLMKKYGIDFRVLGITNSRQMLLDREAIDLNIWGDQLIQQAGGVAVAGAAKT